MNQANLDVWEVRGLQAIIKILEARAEQPVTYTPATVAVMEVYVNRLRTVLLEMKASQGADTDPLSDIARMDRWFYTGFTNLMRFLEERVKQGPPMDSRSKEEIFVAAQRVLSLVPLDTTDYTGSEATDESGTA